MKTPRRYFFFLITLFLAPCFAQGQPQVEIDSISSWIARRLFISSTGFPNADGAILLTPPGPGSCAYGGDYYQVAIPSFATGCAQALLRSTRGDRQDKVYRFMNWFRAHYDAFTVPTPTRDSSHWYYKVGGNPDLKGSQVHCGWGADPAYGDGSLPQFCVLAYEYYRYTGDVTWFLQPGVKTYLEQNMDYIQSVLLQSNNLTWGDAGYPFSLTMDNSTVFWGYDCLGRIEHEIYNDPVHATTYFDVAARVRHAVKTLLFYPGGGGVIHAPDSTYRWHYLGDGFDTTLIDAFWYPRVTATIAPQVNSVENPCDQRSRRQRDLIDRYFDGSPYVNWMTDMVNKRGFDLAYATAYAGETAQAQAFLNTMKARFFYNFQWTYTGADAYQNALAYEMLLYPPDCNYGDLTHAYCTSAGGPSSENSILYLQIGDIAQTSGNTGGRADYKSECHVLKRDSTYQVVLYPGKLASTPSTGLKWRIWIDANQNGQFEGTELCFDRGGDNLTPLTQAFYVPANCSLGYTALRISLKADSSSLAGPCDSGYDGDVEDYCIHIANAVVGLETSRLQVEQRIVPNPVDREIRCTPPLENDLSYEIVDLTGRRIQAGIVRENRVQMGEFPQGVYLLRLASPAGSLVFRFLRR